VLFLIAVLLLPSAGAAAGDDITFFVVADTHYGWEPGDVVNKTQIAAMNGLPGIPYPPEIGGVIGVPDGVLVAGDLCDHKLSLKERDNFFSDYGLTGKEGLLRFPVYECSGNHDGDHVRAGIKKRHGAVKYSWAWGGVLFVNLDVYPTEKTSGWVVEKLADVGPEQPVVFFFHYGFDEGSSEWWKQSERDAFERAISGYNVIALFHGHFHASRQYEWQGFNVYTPGSAKTNHRLSAVPLIVARISGGEMVVGEYIWKMDETETKVTGGEWGWFDRVPVYPETSEVEPGGVPGVSRR
jgi:hypothetical protein